MSELGGTTRPIDVEWRNKAAQTTSRKASSHFGTALGENILPAGDSDSSSNSDEETENEFAQFLESQTEEVGVVPGEGPIISEDAVMEAEGRAYNKMGARRRRSHSSHVGGNGRREDCRAY